MEAMRERPDNANRDLFLIYERSALFHGKGRPWFVLRVGECVHDLLLVVGCSIIERRYCGTNPFRVE